MSIYGNNLFRNENIIDIANNMINESIKFDKLIFENKYDKELIEEGIAEVGNKIVEKIKYICEKILEFLDKIAKMIGDIINKIKEKNKKLKDDKALEKIGGSKVLYKYDIKIKYSDGSTKDCNEALSDNIIDEVQKIAKFSSKICFEFKGGQSQYYDGSGINSKNEIEMEKINNFLNENIYPTSEIIKEKNGEIEKYTTTNKAGKIEISSEFKKHIDETRNLLKKYENTHSTIKQYISSMKVNASTFNKRYSDLWGGKSSNPYQRYNIEMARTALNKANALHKLVSRAGYYTSALAHASATILDSIYYSYDKSGAKHIELGRLFV